MESLKVDFTFRKPTSDGKSGGLLLKNQNEKSTHEGINDPWVEGGGGMKKKETMGIYIPYSNKKAKDIDFLNICSQSKMVAVVIRLKFCGLEK